MTGCCRNRRVPGLRKSQLEKDFLYRAAFCHIDGPSHAVIRGRTRIHDNCTAGFPHDWSVDCGLQSGVFFHQKKNEHQRTLDRQTIRNAQVQQERIIKCINQIYEKSGLSDFYPQEYLFENAVNRIISLIRTRRADTLKEGINLYEEEQHRIHMEQKQNQQLSSLYRAEEVQRRAGDMAALAATMSALSLLRRR